MKFIKNLNSFIIIYFLIISFFSFPGCSTAPVRENFVTYDINGAKYLALVPFCQQKGIIWDYDTFSKSVNLTKGAHKVSLRVGDALALVDGRAEHLHEPVDIYQGEIVVPYRFKEKVFDAVLAAGGETAKGRAVITSVRKVVIDPGHGGHDPGAIGKSGLREKDVNLDISKRLAKLLKEDGIDVVMTRSSDIFIPLDRRGEIANNARADIFISIHANANRVRSLNGLEIYHISTKVSDIKRAVSAARDSGYNFEGEFGSSPSDNLKAILWDMVYANNRGESIRLARNICKVVDCGMDTKVIGVKSAGFQVLKCTRMPAILVETGFLSNKNEERLLRNGFYRQQIAEAIQQGIKDYARVKALAEAY